MNMDRVLPLLLTLASSTIVATSAVAASRDHIDVVGSSTVYPFATVVAETYGNKSGKKTPKIESTGSGGGLKLFCAGVGINTPDITNSSRRIKKSEFDKCQQNGVKDIVEVQIGFDGIAIANAKNAPDFALTPKDIFLALAKQVPGKKEGELIDYPYKRWKEVNSTLPDTNIEVLGPPPTSGTRDAFAELALEGGCMQFGWIKQIKKDSKAAKKAGDKEKANALKSQYKEICHTVREDGAYIEAGENDNLIVGKLTKNPTALGVFGFSFLDQNSDKVKGASINDRPVAIQGMEYTLLHFFMKKPDRLFSRTQLLDHVWGQTVYIDERTVDVHIMRLRKILKTYGVDKLIQTVRGRGYRFVDLNPVLDSVSSRTLDRKQL